MSFIYTHPVQGTTRADGLVHRPLPSLGRINPTGQDRDALFLSEVRKLELREGDTLVFTSRTRLHAEQDARAQFLRGVVGRLISEEAG